MPEETIEDRIAARVLELLLPHLKPQQQWPEVMKIKTAARYIDRTVPGMRSLADKGVIPVAKLDGLVQFRKADLDAWVEKRVMYRGG